MAIRCTVCWAWHPKEWDGSKGHWADTVAKCEIKGKFTCDNENGMMIEPAAYIRYTTPERWFAIQRIWGDKCDPVFDRDVTIHMDKIKIGKYWVN